MPVGTVMGEVGPLPEMTRKGYTLWSESPVNNTFDLAGTVKSLKRNHRSVIVKKVLWQSPVVTNLESENYQVYVKK